MVNDITIIGGIIFIFIIIGAVLPFINSEFGEPEDLVNPQVIADTIGAEEDTIGSVLSGFTVIKSVFLMFFWSFQVPLIIELVIFMPLRILLALIIARNIWVGGGG